MADLTVAMNGIEVGRLSMEASGAMSFRYLDSWYERPGARAISLSLPLKRGLFAGERVFNFFDNLLPDSEAIRARMQARFSVPSSHPFNLLAAVGRDCIGAIQLYPEHEAMPDVQQLASAPLSEAQVAAMLRGYQHAPLGMEADTDFRISLAGAQEKTALLWHNQQWQLPIGSTPTSHILKLPIGFLEPRNIDLRQSNHNEWLCLEILKAYGIDVAKAQLASFEDQNVLVTERFDRRWSMDGRWLMRLPQEDFCQALGVSPALKYENHGGPGIKEGMDLLRGSQQAIHDRETFFKLQILFWMLAAIDGHAKNFSLFIEPGSAYRMTPVYDVLSAYPLMAANSLPAAKAKMAMAVKGKNRHYHWQRIEPRHFISTAKAVGFSVQRAQQVLMELAEKTAAVISRVETLLPHDFPETIADSIFTGLQGRADFIRKA
ncbi:MAG: type II toxin-antitoxin system HipA family toxin [Saccharospirillaceae bacterium]|nr:type II toxin-antitoxin system HipA family toxin [Saccharospirillaceae bacterium]MCD8529972.1 type II toxin-antitoxin system HipA family toxin [Saccharospirillaceae bacterium]